MASKTKILITGAYGFIGTNLSYKLMQDETVELFQLGRYGCDLSDENAVREMMESLKPDVVYHLAGKSVVKENLYDINDTLNQNIIVTNNLLAHCPKRTVFVYPSSATVYGQLTHKYMSFSENYPLNPQSIYAVSKLACEHLVRSYHNQKRVEGIVVRLVANVGKHATHGLLPDLVRKLKSSDQELELLGNWPGSVKPFSYVDDTINAMTKLVSENNYFHSLPINIGPNDQLSVEQVAIIVMDELKIKKPIKWLGDAANWVGDDARVRICNDKARTYYGLTFRSSEEAIRETIRGME